MFRFLLLLSVFLAVALGQQYYCVNAGGQTLRLRSSPGTGSSVVTNIPSGHRTIDLSKPLSSASGYDWRYVEYNSMHGWAANNFLYPCSGPSSPPPAPPSPSTDYSSLYVGCFIDNESRDLDDSYSNPSMTIPMCINRCRDRGYVYAGLQYSTECFCGNQYTDSARVGDEQCNMVCGGQGELPLQKKIY